MRICVNHFTIQMNAQSLKPPKHEIKVVVVEGPVESFLVEILRQHCLEVFLNKDSLLLYLLQLPLSSR